MKRNAVAVSLTLLVLLGLAGFAVPARQNARIYNAACGLGVRWDVSEGGWTGTWVRRGSSNIFDASWRNGSDIGSSVLTMSLNGSRVHIERRDAASWGGAYVEYDVTIASDGTASGTSKVPATGASSPFQATIHCDGTNPPPPTALDLGGTLVVVHPNVCVAIWTRTRPGIYDAVTVCQGPGNASFREVLSVESNDGRNVIISRPKYGRYRGTLSTDRKTITGTCDWTGCTPGFDWTAYVDRDWRNSPPLK